MVWGSIANWETKFLLMGPHDVGKTTFMKQMRIIGTTGYEEDLGEHVRSVFLDLVHAMQTIIRAMDLLGIPYKNPATVECAMVVSSVRASDITTALPMNLAEALRRLWDDAGIKECYGRRIEYGLGEGAQHFVKNIVRITTPGYVPSQEDYLCIKTPSKYISEYSMMLDDEFPSRFVDVGEQKSETKKWIHCFEEVGGVIFMVSLSDYDNVDKMEESRKLFRLIAGSNWFTESHILLLLNKKDIMEEKVTHGIPFGELYPEFRGISSDARCCREHLRRMFAQLEPDRPVYFFFTNATDTEDIKYVLPTLREIASAKTGTRSREPSDAASSTSAMAAVAAAMNGVSTAAAVGAIASPGPALVCSPSTVTATTLVHQKQAPPSTPSQHQHNAHQPPAMVALSTPLKLASTNQSAVISGASSSSIASGLASHHGHQQQHGDRHHPGVHHLNTTHQPHSNHHYQQHSNATVVATSPHIVHTVSTHPHHPTSTHSQQNQAAPGGNPYQQHQQQQQQHHHHHHPLNSSTPPPANSQNHFHQHLASSNKHQSANHHHHHHHTHQHTNNHSRRH